MKRYVSFLCLFGLSVEGMRVDPYYGYRQSYGYGLPSLPTEGRGKLVRVENKNKFEVPLIKPKAIQLNPQGEDKKNFYSDDKIAYGAGYGYGGAYNLKNDGYGIVEEFEDDGKYGRGNDPKDGRYRNNGYGSGIVLEDSKDYYSRYGNVGGNRENYAYINYAGYGALPDIEDRKNVYDGYGYRVDLSQKSNINQNAANARQPDKQGKKIVNVDYLKEDPKDKGYRNDGYYGIPLEGGKNDKIYNDAYISYGEGAYDKIRDSYEKGLINIGYRGFYNRKDDKNKDAFGLGYADSYGYGIGYGDAGFDKIKNEKGLRDGYDPRLRLAEGLDKLNENNIFRYTYLTRVDGETHYKTGLFYYPFEYQIIGAHGLGFDRRSATAFGLAAPTTPKAIQPVGYYRFYKLEKDPQNEYIVDKSNEEGLYLDNKY